MNDDAKRLLDDLLQEAAPASFRDELLGQTLGHVRQRRRRRAVQRRLVGAALLIALPLLLWKTFVATLPPVRQAFPRPVVPVLPYRLVRSQPTPATVLVETKPGIAQVVSSATSHFTKVETNPDEHHYKTLTDDQLLRLFADRSPALIRPAPGQAELLFTEAEPDHTRLVQ